MKQIILILTLFYMVLFADKNVTISIKGDLDDDLFILKSSSKVIEFMDCFQMHNPTNAFLYDGKMIKSERIYGLIDFNKTYSLLEDEILLIMTANEREEIDPKRALLQRTHFKSVDLFANDKVLIPSLMPEFNDVPNYPLWFGKDEKPLILKKKSYNYYQLWENAVVNLGLVFGSRGLYNIYFISSKNEVLYKKRVIVAKSMKNIKLLASHTLIEADGTIFARVSNDNKNLREKAIDAIIIEDGKSRRYIKMPYFFPYINRIFVKGL